MKITTAIVLAVCFAATPAAAQSLNCSRLDLPKKIVRTLMDARVKEKILNNTPGLIHDFIETNYKALKNDMPTFLAMMDQLIRQSNFWGADLREASTDRDTHVCRITINIEVLNAQTHKRWVAGNNEWTGTTTMDFVLSPGRDQRDFSLSVTRIGDKAMPD